MTAADLVKDAGLTALGLSPVAALHLDTALVLGVINLVVVAVIRLVEIRMRYREDVLRMKRGRAPRARRRK